MCVLLLLLWINFEYVWFLLLFKFCILYLVNGCSKISFSNSFQSNVTADAVKVVLVLGSNVVSVVFAVVDAADNDDDDYDLWLLLYFSFLASYLMEIF